MVALDLPLVPISIGARAGRVALSGEAIPTAAGAQTTFDLVSVDWHQQEGAHYPSVKPTSVSWALLAPTGVTFDVPYDAPDLDQIPLATEIVGPDVGFFNREVRLYRNGSLIFEGPCTSRRGGSRSRVWSYNAFDPLWYLRHLYMGEANRHNFIPNGSFADNFVTWTSVGGAVTAINTDIWLIDGQSGEIGSLTPSEAYLVTGFPMTSGADGLALFLTAWVYIRNFDGPATGSGIFASQNPGASIRRVGASGPGSVGIASIDATTPRNQWVRLSAVVNMPPNVSETIEVRLWCVQGDVCWDAVTVVAEESLSLVNINSPGGTGWDEIDIAKQIVRYATGTLPLGDPYDKANLGIAVAGSPAGVIKQRTYQFFDHQPIYEDGTGGGALDEFANAQDGFDWRYDPQTRTIGFFYPAVGKVWDPDVLTLSYVRTTALDGDGNTVPTGSYVAVVEYDWPENIDQSANCVTVLGGWGDGAGREEGGANYTGQFGDLQLELIVSAPTETPIDLLKQMAASIADVTAHPQTTPTLTLVEPRDPDTGEVTVPLIGVLLPGDWVQMLIDDGPVQFADWVRVLGVVYNPETETLAVTIMLFSQGRAGGLLPG